MDFRVLFMGYCAVCVVNAVVSLTMWPDTPYDAAEEEQVMDELEGSVHRPHLKVTLALLWYIVQLEIADLLFLGSLTSDPAAIGVHTSRTTACGQNKASLE